MFETRIHLELKDNTKIVEEKLPPDLTVALKEQADYDILIFS